MHSSLIVAHRIIERTREIALGVLKKGPPKFRPSGESPSANKKAIVIWGLILLCGLMVGDLASNLIINFLPKAPTSSSQQRTFSKKEPYLKGLSNYDTLTAKNMFCPGCPLPPLQIRTIDRPKDCSKASPVKGSLSLIGTIVLTNSQYSVATFDLGSNTEAYRTGEQVPGYGKVFEIRRNRVCLENADGILNFVEFKDLDVIQMGDRMNGMGAGGSGGGEGIAQKSDTEFEIEKNVLKQKCRDPNLLFQAHAVPYTENGAMEGFKILSIDPGSIYESLGLKVGDVIKGANGTPLQSLGQANSLYSSVCDTSEVVLDVMRDGRTMSLNYSVK